MKKPWLFRVYSGWETTQLCGEYFINHDKDPYWNKQDFMESKTVFLCFVAQFDENELNRWDNVALEPRCHLVLEQAMKTSLRLAEYEDILDTQTIYSLIVGNLRWQKDLNCWCENQSLRTFDQALWSYTSWDFWALIFLKHLNLFSPIVWPNSTSIVRFVSPTQPPSRNQTSTVGMERIKALTTYYNKFFAQCSRAFIKLEVWRVVLSLSWCWDPNLLVQKKVIQKQDKKSKSIHRLLGPGSRTAHFLTWLVWLPLTNPLKTTTFRKGNKNRMETNSSVKPNLWEGFGVDFWFVLWFSRHLKAPDKPGFEWCQWWDAQQVCWFGAEHLYSERTTGPG